MNFLRQLSIAASAAVACASAFGATIATNHVSDAIIHQYASATALYMDGFVTPYVQELANSNVLSEGNRKTLGGLFAPTTIGRPIVGFRIWADNRIIFSDDHNMIGRYFEPSPARNRAWAGDISAELDSLDGDDDVQIYALNVSILEISSPIRQAGTDRIIALAETYEIASDLKLKLLGAQALIWAIFAAAALGTTLLLLALSDIATREMSRLHHENDEYRARIGGANRRVCDLNEQHLRRVGKDLQDGPMRFVALALLKLDSLRGHFNPSDVETISSALNKTMGEMRSLSASLVPSKVGNLSLAETIVAAARRHESHTGMPVDYQIGPLPNQIPFAMKACLYRFVHDGLAYGSSDSCAVRAVSKDNVFEVEIVCGTSGTSRFQRDMGSNEALRNLRDRVEALGGALFVQSRVSFHSITAQFRLSEADLIDG